MRFLFLLLSLIYSFSVFSQVNDSITNKLKQYKDLHEKGLIDDAEYKSLKENVLKLNAKNNVPSKEKIIEDYKKGTGQLVSGSILLGMSVSFIVGGVAFKNNKVPNPNEFYSRGKFETESYNSSLKGYRRGYRSLFISGILTGGVSVFSFVRGSINRSKYNAQNRISLNILPNNVYFSYQF